MTFAFHPDGDKTVVSVGSDFDPRSFPTVKHGHRYEDFEVGQVWRHHWGRTLTESDNLTFCSAMCNWNPLYINRAYANKHGHSDMVVNPMLVLCVVVGMSVEDLSEAGGPFLGVNQCTFNLPVYPGDTLTADSTVKEMRLSSSRPGVGIVTWETRGRNQEGQTVIEYLRTNLVAIRPDAAL
jgi:itaconyl-CoA hydratase